MLIILSIAQSRTPLLLRNRMGPGQLRAARLSIAQARAALLLRNYTGRTALIKLIGLQSLKRERLSCYSSQFLARRKSSCAFNRSSATTPLVTEPQESRSAIVSRFQSLSRDRPTCYCMDLPNIRCNGLDLLSIA
jgi:hypothetical protein